MNDEGFITTPFPKDVGIVYILSFKQNGAENLVPFYIGESGRGTRRIGEYISAQFSAATDFKVGVAAKALQAAGCEVFVSYKESVSRKDLEAELISSYKSRGFKLLNHEASYNYKTADKSAEKLRFEAFVLSLL
jgi:hypothetical protein